MRVYFAVCWVWFKLELSNLPRFKVYRHIFWRTYGRRHAATIAKRSRRRVVCRSCNREGLILSNAMWSQNEEQIQANWEIWLSKLLTISANYVTTCIIQYFYMQIDTVDTIYIQRRTNQKKNARNSEKSRKITWGQFTTTGDFCQTFSQRTTKLKLI